MITDDTTPRISPSSRRAPMRAHGLARDATARQVPPKPGRVGGRWRQVAVTHGTRSHPVVALTAPMMERAVGPVGIEPSDRPGRVREWRSGL